MSKWRRSPVECPVHAYGNWVLFIQKFKNQSKRCNNIRCFHTKLQPSNTLTFHSWKFLTCWTGETSRFFEFLNLAAYFTIVLLKPVGTVFHWHFSIDETGEISSCLSCVFWNSLFLGKIVFALQDPLLAFWGYLTLCFIISSLRSSSHRDWY